MTTRARGRPSLYRDESSLRQARKLYLLGATDQDLAEFFEIDVRTIYDWKRTKPEFSQAIMRGKMLADAGVAVKLYRQDDGCVLQVPFTIEHPPGHPGRQSVVAQPATSSLARQA
jgi:hypothetical protein